MALLFQTIGYFLALTIPIALVVWTVVGIFLMRRKQQYIAAAELADIRAGRDMTAILRLTFMFTPEMLADPAIRRLRLWRRMALAWPFLVVALLVLIFNLFPVSPGV